MNVYIHKAVPLLSLCFLCICLLTAEGNEKEIFKNFNAPFWYRGFSPEQEIVGARTLNTKVFISEEGHRIYRIFSHPVHCMTGQGMMEDLPDRCPLCDSNWQVGESFSGYVDGLFEDLFICGQTATYIQANEAYYYRGFVEFNTDAVPDTATIDSLVLTLNCAQWPVYNEDHDIWSMESQPSASGAMTVYYDAMDGDCYVDEYLGGTGWNSWGLDSTAIETFTDQLTDDWFAVGISDFYSASAYFLLYQCSSGYIDAIGLGVAEEKPAMPANTMTMDIEPNPFSATTTITLTIPGAHKSTGAQEKTRLHIYSMAGSLIRSFSLPPAYSLLNTEVTWDGRDGKGNPVPSGTYFCKVSMGKNPVCKKVLLIR